MMIVALKAGLRLDSDKKRRRKEALEPQLQ
jgi:hypothetical protein